jgi:hypothetical protein
MGRPFSDIDVDRLVELGRLGFTQKQASEELGVSIPTLSKRMTQLKDQQGILLRYRELQTLQLTSLQARVLEAITPEKINEAPLRDLILAFKILKDKELIAEGKPSEIKGLVGYLVELEKKETAVSQEEYTDAEVVEAAEVTREVMKNVEDPDYIPDL